MSFLDFYFYHVSEMGKKLKQKKYIHLVRSREQFCHLCLDLTYS